MTKKESVKLSLWLLFSFIKFLYCIAIEYRSVSQPVRHTNNKKQETLNIIGEMSIFRSYIISLVLKIGIHLYAYLYVVLSLYYICESEIANL